MKPAANVAVETAMSSYASQEYLASIQEGDEVLVCGDFGRRRIGLVTALTKTQIVVGGSRYCRLKGHLKGQGSYNRSRIGTLTPEIREELTRIGYVELISRVELSRVKDVPTENLRLAAIYLGMLDEPVRVEADEPVRDCRAEVS